jgi:hypothetical protein
MRAVSDLKFHIGEGVYQFVPEMVMADNLPFLLPLFMAFTQLRGSFDVAGYLDEYALWHCFRTVE